MTSAAAAIDPTDCAHCGAPLAPSDYQRPFALVSCSACRAVYDVPPFPPPFAAVPRPGDRCEPLTETAAAHGDERVLVPRPAATRLLGAAAVVLFGLPMLGVFGLVGWGVSASRGVAPRAGAAGLLLLGGTVAVAAAAAVALRRAAAARRRVRIRPGAVAVERVPGAGRSAAPVGAPERVVQAGELGGLRCREYTLRGSGSVSSRHRYELLARGRDGGEAVLVRGIGASWTALFTAQEAARALGMERTAAGWAARGAAR